MNTERIEETQRELRAIGVAGWLLYNFRDSNEIASRMMGFDSSVHQTRRWLVLIPAEGEPVGLFHTIEPHLANEFPGAVRTYSSRHDFQREARSILDGYDHVAMEYSPGNRLPVVSRVDAGTIEFIRDFGVDVVSSGELIARLESKLDRGQIDLAVEAGKNVRAVMLQAFRMVRDAAREQREISEYDVKRRIVEELENRGMYPDHDPIVAVGANSADPHYSPTAERFSPIRPGDHLLIDLWGRSREPRGVFGDITWIAYVGSKVPEQNARIFSIVRAARNAGLDLVKEAFASNRTLTGAEVDDAVREIIEDAGFGEQFVHRTGHSISTDLHGAGTNLDNYETEDDRPILRSTSFSIEPGIYLTGEFGVRSEIDVVITAEGEVLVPSGPAQEEIIPLLSGGIDE